MSTPEGRVKDSLKRLLARLGPYVHASWPVQNGMGSPMLDCHTTAYSYSVVIECKAPGELPSPRQWITIGALRAAGAFVFVYDYDGVRGERHSHEDVEYALAALRNGHRQTAKDHSSRNIDLCRRAQEFADTKRSLRMAGKASRG